MVTRPANGIPVGLSIVPYLVSYVRNTLVILTLGTAATEGTAGVMCQAPDWMVVDPEGKIVATSPCRRTCLVHPAPLAFPLEQMV